MRIVLAALAVLGLMAWFQASHPNSPGGSNGQVQWNSGGMFAGAAGVVTDGTSLSVGGLRVATVAASGIAVMPSGNLSAGNCFAPVVVAALGLTSADTVSWTFNARPDPSWESFIVHPYVAAGSVGFLVCNPPGGGSQTLVSATLNWKVVR